MTQDPWAAVLAAVQAEPDPSTRGRTLGQLLDSIPDLQRRLREARQQAFRELHDGGMSWAEIGEDQGVDRTRAAQIARGVSGGTKRRKEADD